MYNYKIQWKDCGPLGLGNGNWQNIQKFIFTTYAEAFNEAATRARINITNSYRILRELVPPTEDVIVVFPSIKSIQHERTGSSVG